MKFAASQSVEWIDTANYGREIAIVDILINSKNEPIIFGAYGDGYDAPDLSNSRTFVECLTSNGERKWINDQISGAEAASNLAQDEAGNFYVSLWLSGLNNNVPKVEDQEYEAGTYLIKLSSQGKVQWVSQKQSPHSLPGQTRIMPNGEIVVTSVRAGGSARHVYNSTGNLLSSQLDPKLGYAQFDRFGNGYQRYGENGQVYLIKYDSAENESWRITINNQTRFFATHEGDLYLLETGPYFTSQLQKLNTDSKILWIRKFTGESEFKIHSDGANLYVAGLYGSGNTAEGQVINKIDIFSGETLWQSKLKIPEHRVNALTSSEGALYIAINSVFEEDAMLVRLTDAQWQEPAKDVTGLKNNAPESVFSVFPNPGVGAFTVSSPDNCPGFSFKVLDAAGRVITERAGCAGDERIELKHCTKGVYQVRIQPANGPAQVKKIIVE